MGRHTVELDGRVDHGKERFVTAGPLRGRFVVLVWTWRGDEGEVLVRRGRGRPPAADRKQLVSLRLDGDVIEKFRATGPGWQARINEALRLAKVG